MPEFPKSVATIANVADVWTYTARTITALTGQPRTDIIGENASFEAGSGARLGRIDRLDNVPAYEAVVEASIEMSGSEQSAVEKIDDKIGILDGYIDFTPLVSGDALVIRQYMKVKAGGEYIKYAEETYDGVQSVPLLHLSIKTTKTAGKVTLEQSATGSGGYKTLDVQFYRSLQA